MTPEALEERNRKRLEMFDRAMAARPPQCKGMHLEAAIRKLSECPAQPVEAMAARLETASNKKEEQ